MKKTLIYILLAGILLISFGCKIATPGSTENDSSKILYEYKTTNKGASFINYYAGYTYNFSNDLSPNLDFISKRVRFENENIIIDIFHEKANDIPNYTYYTDIAITENVNLTVTEQTNFVYSSYATKKLSWEREKLQRIENDKNFYTKYDILKDNQAYTILIKSNEKISGDEYLNNLTFSKKLSFDESFVRSLDKKLTSNVESKNLNEETRKLYNDYFLNSEKLSWGIFSPDFCLGNPNLEEYEEKIGYNFPFILQYTGIESYYSPELVEDFLERAYADGKIVEMTLQPPLWHESKQYLFDVLNGQYDDFLRVYAQAISDFGHPVLLRLFNEMNGDWCEYSSYKMSIDTDLYIELYKYVYSFFEDAENVLTIWNPNGRSFPNFDWNADILHYPGPDYVDIIGLTMYNTGNFYEGEKWSTFTELYERLYHEMVQRTDLPLMITEFASSRIGGDKEAWVRDMFEKIKQYDRIKVAVWWNSADATYDGSQIARPYYIDDSEEMIEIFKENLK